jgi:hypothetical protein
MFNSRAILSQKAGCGSEDTDQRTRATDWPGPFAPKVLFLGMLDYEAHSRETQA